MLDNHTLDRNQLKKDREGKKCVALVGFATTTRDMAPYDDPNIEIWSLNEGYKALNADGEPFLKRWDRWFQLHSRPNFARSNNPNDPEHFRWLKEASGFPIYMQKHYKDIPSSVRYPIEKYIDAFGRYGTSTFAFMLGLALLEGYERIELYGFEMQMDTEYAKQRPNAEYMIGRAIERVDVYIPPKCGLLKATLYGYQDMSVGYRQQMEMRAKSAEKQHRDELDNLNRMLGAYDVLKKLSDENPDNEELLKFTESHFQKLQSQTAMVNVVYGKMEGVAELTKIYDNWPFEQEQAEEDEVGGSNGAA